MNKVFSDASNFWNWLVVSSKNPNQVAATVKGSIGLLVTFAMTYLPLLGVKVSPDLSSVPDIIYSLIISVLGLVSGVVFIAGLARKLKNTITNQ